MSGEAVLQRSVTIIGGGPAGLMAAEVLAQPGVKVDVYDGMATFGRKFLLAGRGGLNLTHTESRKNFAARYGNRQAQVDSWLQQFAPQDVRAWAHALGVETFVGSSGRVFPLGMKASPLLRKWLQRLHDGGVSFHRRHLWSGAFAQSGAASIDSVGRSTSSRACSDREEEIAEITAALKALAMELNVPIVVLAQLNRNPDARSVDGKGRPHTSDLPRCGSIEQHADILALLVREESTTETGQQNEDAGEKATLIIAKQRNGPIGEVPLTFRKEYSRFATAA